MANADKKEFPQLWLHAILREIFDAFDGRRCKCVDFFAITAPFSPEPLRANALVMLVISIFAPSGAFIATASVATGSELAHSFHFFFGRLPFRLSLLFKCNSRGVDNIAASDRSKLCDNRKFVAKMRRPNHICVH